MGRAKVKGREKVEAMCIIIMYVENGKESGTKSRTFSCLCVMKLYMPNATIRTHRKCYKHKYSI